MTWEEKELIKYLETEGLKVNTSTKARGHQGFYLKNRIDISKNIPDNRVIPTLLHEYAHYIHAKIEPGMEKTNGSLQVIFNDEDVSLYQKELLRVTNFVDPHSKCEKLKFHKQLIKEKIAACEKNIRNKYPKFLRSKKFKEFDKYIKKSKARYLLKYDRVKLISGVLFKKTEIFSIDNIENDFCDMPSEFAAYIRLKSYQKKQTRISSKINKMNKYYSKPTELFARLVEGLYLNSDEVQSLAPHTCRRFFELLHDGYYGNLSFVLEMI